MNPGYERCHGRLLAALHLLFLIRRIPRTRFALTRARAIDWSVPNRGKSGRSTGDIYGPSPTTYIHTSYILRTYSSLYKAPQVYANSNTNNVRWRSLGSPILPSRGFVQEPRERVPAANEERCVLDGRLHLQAHCLVK